MHGWDFTSRWITLGGFALIMAIACFQLSGHTPLPAEAPVDAFSAQRANATLRRLLGPDQRPHPVGSAANDDVRQRLIGELESIGLEPEQQSVVVKGIPIVNVLARVTDAQVHGRPLLLVTHYDSAPRAAGAGDSGSGIVALLETARALRQIAEPSRHPIYLLFTDGEEAGLLGAQGFAREHPLLEEQPMVLNFDARGTSGASLMYETPINNLRLIRQIAPFLPRPTLTSSAFVTVYRRMPNGTDFTIFLQRGCLGLNFAFIGDVRNYHQSTDRLELLDLRSLQHHGDNALAMTRMLTAIDWDDLQSDEDAVFGDLMGLVVLAYPQSSALRWSLVPLLLMLCRAWNRKRDRCFWLQGGRSLLAILASVATVVVLGIAVSFAFRTLTVAIPWDQFSMACFVAYGAMALTITQAIASRVLGPVSDEDCGIWIWWWFSIAGIAMAGLVPGASHYFLWPALAGGVWGLMPLSARARNLAAAWSAGIVLIPTVMLLNMAIRASAPQVLLPLHALAMIPLYPLFLRRSPRPAPERGA